VLPGERVEQRVLRAVRFGDEQPTWIRPSYDGLGIANLPWSILAALGGEPQGPPVSSELWPEPLAAGVGAVLLLVVDGLGYNQLLRAMADGSAPALAQLRGEAAWFPLTSVFPSTTAAALTTLATGQPPARHGLVGFTCYLREFGMLSNLLFWTPLGKFPSYASQGLDPRAFLPVPTIAELGAQQGIDCVVVAPEAFAEAPLTRMHSAAASYLGYRTAGQFVAHVHRALAVPGRCLVTAYWDSIDNLGHFSGLDHPATLAELRLLDRLLVDELLAHLPRRDTLVVLTADHGMVPLDPAREHRLNGLPLLDQVAVPPGGERRAVYWYARPEQREVLWQGLQELAGADGWLARGEALLRDGLLGPPPHHPEAVWRLGDVVLVARGGASFPYDPPGITPRPSFGAHAGLEAEEQLVPCLVWRP
jgi:hypothetical protein